MGLSMQEDFPSGRQPADTAVSEFAALVQAWAPALLSELQLLTQLLQPLTQLLQPAAAPAGRRPKL